MPEVPHLESPAEEGQRLASAAQMAGLPLKLFGGVAVWLRCVSAHEPALQRDYGDMDFVTVSRAVKGVTQFFETNGYEADRLFNAIHGAQRLSFTDSARGRPVDVIVDRFAMCHTIDLRDRLEPSTLTIPITDLLLTKLQIVQLNDKDLRDILALLADHAVGARDHEAIDTARIGRLTHDDWGLEHTIRRTLATVRERSSGFGLNPEVTETVRRRVDALLTFLDTAPKSLSWRLRAQVGERVRWYELPEETRR